VNLSDEDNPGNEISQIEAELEEFAEVSGELTSTGTIDQGHIVYCRASKSDCPRCEVHDGSRPQNYPRPRRRCTRSHRPLANAEAFQQSRREREKVEM
jgi:hypothetical protein